MARPSLAQLPPQQQMQIQQQLEQAQQQQRRDSSLTLPPLRTIDRAAQHNNPLWRLVNIGKVAPPLKKPAGVEAPFPVRGTAIAIEGDSDMAVASVASWLQGFLNRSEECAVKSAKGVDVPEPEKQVTITDYLTMISQWHKKAEEMKHYLTTPVKAEDDAGNIPNKTVLPVILIPHYQLYGASEWASRIPISDAYGPSDHWSWMATLWRGVLGPDVTIYVRDAGPDEMAKEKSIEVQEAARCIVVRREKGAAADGGIEDRSLRRLGFEVGEWIRTISLQLDASRVGS